MKRWAILFCVMGAAVLASGKTQGAETPSEMLEKGIYNEETVGDLEEAIRLYREVVAAADEAARVGAQAQYRLGLCLLKQKKTDEAQQAFQQLVEKYPDQHELVAKAKQHLPSPVEFLAAPWKNGERLTLAMQLAGGQPIGIIGLGVDADSVDNRDVWKMLVRRYVAGGSNEGVSEAVVDRNTNRPVSTNWRHTILGKSHSRWTDDKLFVTTFDKSGKPTDVTIDLDGPAYCNDQWFYGMRQLPLKVGYEVILPLRVAFTGGNPVGLEVAVNEIEMIKTPAGEFSCFKLETNIGQTFWVADVPERYLVKFAGGGVDAFLTSISDSTTTDTIETELSGIRFKKPAGWFEFHPDLDDDGDKKKMYQLIAPSMAAIHVIVEARSNFKEEEQKSLAAWVESHLDRGRRTYKDLKVIESRADDTKLAGNDARSFVVEHTLENDTVRRNAIFAFVEDYAVTVMSVAAPAEFDAIETEFKKVVESVSTR